LRRIEKNFNNGNIVDLYRDSIYSSSLADMFLNQITQQEGSETQ
jgi:hypothetical protein